jgi:hypothetical protein
MRLANQMSNSEAAVENPIEFRLALEIAPRPVQF